MERRSAAIAVIAATAGLCASLLEGAFILLRLLHKITWPWWWVASPLWITAALTTLTLAGLVAVATYRDTH